MKKKAKADNNSPAFEARVGSVRVSVWKNASEAGAVYFNTTIERRYRDTDNEWKASTSFTGYGDCVLAAAALDLAREFLKLQELGQDA